MIYELANKRTKINPELITPHTCNWRACCKINSECERKQTERQKGKQFVGWWTKHSQKLIENYTIKFIEF